MMESDLKGSGWSLSSDGLALCSKLCKEKGLKPSAKTVSEVALDLDLRSIGCASLSEDLARQRLDQVEGPLVLQIQKIKNVAVSSSKQHDPSPTKRLLRLQLTDGHILVSATEMEGPIPKLSPATPPGTKVRIKGHISVLNGFLLLRKSSVEVLGGSVEVLLKKWNLQKAVPDNIDRRKLDEENGPPLFVKFSKLNNTIAGEKPKTKQNVGKGLHRHQSPAPTAAAEVAPTREKMELPQSYQVERGDGGGKKEREAVNSLIREGYKKLDDRSRDVLSRGADKPSVRTSLEENSADYFIPQSKPQTGICLSDFFNGLSLGEGKTDDIEDVGSAADKGSRIESGKLYREDRHHDNRKGREREFSERKSRELDGKIRESSGRSRRQPSEEQESSGTRGRGRGRGRGRRPDRERQDDYHPQRRKESYQLCDFFERTATIKDGDENDVLEDYEYDHVSDQYFVKGSRSEPSVLEDYVYDSKEDRYFPKSHKKNYGHTITTGKTKTNGGNQSLGQSSGRSTGYEQGRPHRKEGGKREYGERHRNNHEMEKQGGRGRSRDNYKTEAYGGRMYSDRGTDRTGDHPSNSKREFRGDKRDKDGGGGSRENFTTASLAGDAGNHWDHIVAESCGIPASALKHKTLDH